MALNGFRFRVGCFVGWSGSSCRPTDERIRYLNNTGTSVKDNARLAISDTQTGSDRGEKRYLAVPCNRKIGTKTMQMHRVESIVGTPTSPAPLMIAFSKGSFSWTWRSI